MSGSTYIQYNDAAFRALLPYFANTTTYPEAQLQMYFNFACDFVQSNPNFSATLSQQTDLLYLMTAHLQQLFVLVGANNGASPNIEIAGSIDKIRVALQPPIAKTVMQQWLNQTPFGQQLRALLQSLSTGGFFFAGRGALSGFRNSTGGFG